MCYPSDLRARCGSSIRSLIMEPEHLASKAQLLKRPYKGFIMQAL
jgi:hypothetical protein